MNLQCQNCLEPTVAGERHSCAEVISSLRELTNFMERENTRRERAFNDAGIQCAESLALNVKLETRIALAENTGELIRVIRGASGMTVPRAFRIATAIQLFLKGE